MKIRFIILLAMLIANVTLVANVTLAATKSETKNTADAKKISAALVGYLATQGDLCLGKFDWPIDVSARDVAMGTRDALQMPVLEKLGLVSSSTGVALRKEATDTEQFIPVTHYSLTDKGKKFYVNKPITTVSADKTIVHPGDVCVAKLSLDKLIRWEPMAGSSQEAITMATYTYKVVAVEWAHDADFQKVFPMIDRVIKGESNMELQQRVRLDNKTWVAVNSRE